MIGRFYWWRGKIWRVIARGEPFDRGPRRNVLIEDICSKKRVVRPFRGLRRVRIEEGHTLIWNRSGFVIARTIPETWRLGSIQGARSGP